MVARRGIEDFSFEERLRVTDTLEEVYHGHEPSEALLHRVIAPVLLRECYQGDAEDARTVWNARIELKKRRQELGGYLVELVEARELPADIALDCAAMLRLPYRPHSPTDPGQPMLELDDSITPLQRHA